MLTRWHFIALVILFVGLFVTFVVMLIIKNYELLSIIIGFIGGIVLVVLDGKIK